MDGLARCARSITPFCSIGHTSGSNVRGEAYQPINCAARRGLCSEYYATVLAVRSGKDVLDTLFGQVQVQLGAEDNVHVESAQHRNFEPVAARNNSARQRARCLTTRRQLSHDEGGICVDNDAPRQLALANRHLPHQQQRADTSRRRARCVCLLV